ncbi:hypothetical protein [Palleronia abyssalis]|uniref:Uncharacterized protein n=1 Tax=Palleronia abyssalis TaxID=1501240 RepID=A0A2R8BZ26_9RHOB|nr:hypothetical protein [Palleronia abyssalis]SPJ25363.1 hypothetical protein PAA8504_03214 [Palleronia abyssalis]
MRTLVLLILAVTVIVAILIATGFLDLSPEGEAAIEDARENVGGAIEEAGEAVQGDGKAD